MTTDGTCREETPGTIRGRTLVFLAVCALGVSSMITQLTLMRELLGVFAGNEMVFGVVLGNWLLLTGLGSYLGRSAERLKRPLCWLIVAQMLVAVLPVGSVLAVRTLRNVVFVRGAMIGVTGTVVSCFVLLLPYCLISGYLLTLACKVLARGRGPESIGQVYFLDSIGDIAGGLVFTFVLIALLSHFGCLYVPAFLNLLLAGAVAILRRRVILLAAAAGVAVALAGIIVAVDLDEYSTRVEHAGYRVLYRGNSPYGSLVVTESAGQLNFIENGLPLFSTHNIGQVEETVHYAMAQRPKAKLVLLISGGVSGTAREILKYGVQRVDYVELDPLIIEVARRLGRAPDDPRIRVIEGDGRQFVKTRRGGERYDVVIADVPDPSTSQVNRFYTREFFREVKRALAPGGVLCFSLGRYENYVSRELARLIGTANRTLKEVFANVLILPAGRLFFLASDGELTADIAAPLAAAGIKPQLLRPSYLEAMLSPDRMADVARAASPQARVNTDFSPVLYYHHLLLWMSRFRVSFSVLEGLLIAALVVYLLRIRRVSFAIFTTGFAAAALELVLIVAFQILYGSVYHRLGLIVTAFMAGLAAGALIMNRLPARRSRRDLAKLELAIVVYAALLPFVLMALGRIESPVLAGISANAVFPLLTLLLGALVGMEFPLAGRADFQSTALTASKLYTADLVGACIGAMLVSTLLIPLIGVVAVCGLTAGLNALSGMVLLLKRGN